MIGIQVFFAGVALPKQYLKTEFQSLVVLLLPVMATAWFVCGLLIFQLIPQLTFVSRRVNNFRRYVDTDSSLADGSFVDRRMHYTHRPSTRKQYYEGAICRAERFSQCSQYYVCMFTWLFLLVC